VRLDLPPNRGKNTTVVASITSTGMGETMAVEGSTTQEVFEAYVERPGTYIIGRRGSDHGQPLCPQTG
jgi:hypothetical protein